MYDWKYYLFIFFPAMCGLNRSMENSIHLVLLCAWMYVQRRAYTHTSTCVQAGAYFFSTSFHATISSSLKKQHFKMIWTSHACNWKDYFSLFSWFPWQIYHLPYYYASHVLRLIDWKESLCLHSVCLRLFVDAKWIQFKRQAIVLKWR